VPAAAARYYCAGRTVFIGIVLEILGRGEDSTVDPSRKDVINYDYVIIFIVDLE